MHDAHGRSHRGDARELAEALRTWIEREELTQAQASKRLGITQPLERRPGPALF